MPLAFGEIQEVAMQPGKQVDLEIISGWCPHRTLLV